MNEPEYIDNSEPDIPSNPGEILTRERKKLRLSQQDIADQLNLRLDVVDMLESGEYENIAGGETFVRGYIRAYARLLDIDEDDVLEERDYMAIPNVEHTPFVTPVLNRSALNKDRPRPVRRIRPGHSKLGLVFLVLLVAIIATWSFSDIPEFSIGQWIGSLTESDQEALVVADNQVSGELPVQVNVTRLDMSEFNQQQSNENESGNQGVDLKTDTVVPVIADNSAQGSQTELTLTGESPVLDSNESAVTLGAEQELVTVSVPAGEVISLTQDDSAEPQSIATANSADETIELQIQNTLMLVSQDTSWAEVRDASGKRLLYAMLQPRQPHNLKGQAPFDITLGNASTVKVRLDDSPMDISNHIRTGRTAHLRVGTEGVSNTR